MHSIPSLQSNCHSIPFPSSAFSIFETFSSLPDLPLIPSFKKEKTTAQLHALTQSTSDEPLSIELESQHSESTVACTHSSHDFPTASYHQASAIQQQELDTQYNKHLSTTSKTATSTSNTISNPAIFTFIPNLGASSRDVYQNAQRRLKWLQHTTLNQFPTSHTLQASQFQTEYENLVTRIFAPISNDQVNTSALPPFQYLWRAPTLFEMIEELFKHESKDWIATLPPHMQSQVQRFYQKSRKLNRFPCQIPWLYATPDENPWSEIQLTRRIQQQTSLETVQLVLELNAIRLQKTLVSFNFARHIHPQYPHTSSLHQDYSSHPDLHEPQSFVNSVSNCKGTSGKDAKDALNSFVSKTTAYTPETEIQTHCQNMLKNDMPLLKKNVILSFSFYHPVRGHRMASFDLYDQQTLADLRDVFFCDEDLHGPKFQSSMFLINQILYPDQRDPDYNAYSAHVLHFLNLNRSETSPDRIRMGPSQQEITLQMLQIPLRTPCAFLHQGDCEHRVVCTSIRIFNPSLDCPIKNCYPIRTYEPSTRIKNCEICEENRCTKMVFNAWMLPKNPTYACNDCVSKFLYDIDDELVDSHTQINDYTDLI